MRESVWEGRDGGPRRREGGGGGRGMGGGGGRVEGVWWGGRGRVVGGGVYRSAISYGYGLCSIVGVHEGRRAELQELSKVLVLVFELSHVLNCPLSGYVVLLHSEGDDRCHVVQLVSAVKKLLERERRREGGEKGGRRRQ